MKKLIASFFLLLFAVICLAQQQQLPIIPTDPQVLIGQLPNGMTYYIRKNSLPKERADFYIAQKVGSVIEEPNERGLAHFLEHMAFNGTTHFPNKDLLNYLQRIGVKFGENVNAYTSVEQTVYMVTNVPVVRETVIDSCLLILRDWANGITLSDTEIEKERGVIEEEWRSRNSAWLRMAETILPTIYGNDKYADCLPIGHIDVIRNFKPDELRAFYKKWYRPDLQAIIIVGDFDPQQVEAKLKATLGTIAMPSNPIPRPVYAVTDNQEPIIAFARDKEATAISVEVSIKQDVFPTEMKGTIAYMMQEYVHAAVSGMMGSRFNEMIQKPNPPFTQAYAYTDNFWVSNTKDARTLYAIASEQGATTAIKSLITENERMRQFGFTIAEYEREKANILKNIENQYNEREKQQNYEYVPKYINHFLENTPIPSIEYTFETYKQLAEMIPLELINNIVKQASTTGNMVIVVQGPEDEKISFPTAEEILSGIEEVKRATIEPYTENVSNEPLISKLPKPGKIKKEITHSNGTTDFILSNKVTVRLVPTNHKDDEILFQAYSHGGYSLVDKQYATTLKVLPELSTLSGLGNFSAIDLQKRLSGKNLRLSKQLNTYSESLNGYSGKKDVEMLFQLAYLHFTGIRSDQDAFQTYINRQSAVLKNRENSPYTTFIDTINHVLYDSHPLMTRLKSTDLSTIDYQKGMKILSERYANAADFTFVLVGNLDSETLRPLLTKYIATLPAKGKKETWKDAGVTIKEGNNTLHYNKIMEVPKSSTIQYTTGKIPYTLENRIKLTILSQILDIVYTEKVREDEGGTYGVSVDGNLDAIPYNRFTLETYFDTDESKRSKLVEIINQEFLAIASQGPRTQDLQKVKEFLTKQYQENLIENWYWQNVEIEKIITNLDIHTDYLTILEKIDEHAIQQFANVIEQTSNKKEIVQIGTK